MQTVYGEEQGQQASPSRRPGDTAPYIGAEPKPDVVPRRPGRGGRRNSAFRATQGLSLRQCQNVWDAAHFAVLIDRPLNRFVTVNWTTGCVGDPLDALGRYIKRAGDWLRDRGVDLVYVWTREAVGGDHVHLLIHVPCALSRAFTRMNRQWLRLAGAKRAKRAVRTLPVARSYDAYSSSPAYYQVNLRAALAYILKGALPAAVAYTREYQEYAGVVVGKRSGTSLSIGGHARGRASYFGNPPTIPPRQRRGWHLLA